MQTSIAFSCKCKHYTLNKARKLNYNNNELIFIGTVLESSDSSYTFIVNEVLKGKADSVIIGGINYCSYKPKKDEIWLVYTNYQSDSTIIINRCSLSRSFSNPVSHIVYDLPVKPPPLPGQKRKIPTKQYLLKKEMIRYRALIDLVEEINILRYKKLEKYETAINK
jgi:hypothetical protein